MFLPVTLEVSHDADTAMVILSVVPADALMRLVLPLTTDQAEGLALFLTRHVAEVREHLDRSIEKLREEPS